MSEVWEVLTLGEVAKLHYGKAMREDDRVAGTIPVVGSAGTFGWHNESNVSTDGSIVVGRKGTAGSVAWFDEKVWASDTTYWVEPQVEIDFKFLFLAMLNTNLPALTAQSGVPGLNRDRAYSSAIPVPPLPEQRRIVDLIGALDEAIEAADAAASLQQSLFEALLETLIGPVPGPVDGNPLAKLVAIVDCEHKTAPATDGEVFAHSIGTADIRNGRILADSAKPVSRATYDEWTNRTRPQTSDVIFTREAPVGQVGLVASELGPLCLGQRTVLLRAKRDSLLTGEYLWLSLLSRSYQRWLSEESIGLTVARVNVKTLAQLRLSVPTVAVQQEVSGQATAALNAVDETRRYAASLRDLRQNLLAALLSGEHEIPSSYDEHLGVVA